MYEWDYFDEEQEYHPMTDADNLYDGFVKASKGSKWKAQVKRFRWNLLEELRKLQVELINMKDNKPGAYTLSPYSKFTVNERGKTRAITALCIRDRVVKHVLNDVFLLPHIRPKLIYDNGASLSGKGVSFTRNRLIVHLESFYRETGSNDGYIMIIDFSGYYDNIDHIEAMNEICEYESDEFARRLVWQAFDSYKVDVSCLDEDYISGKFNAVEYRKANYPQEGKRYMRKSLSVGDQTSQTTAILFPTPIDKLVTIVCGFKYYGRYMDDLYVIAETREELLALYDRIMDKAAELKIIINQNKIKISKLSRTFRFLQFKYFLTDNGHVVVRINPKTVNKMCRKLKALASPETIFKSWFGSFYKYMSNHQIIKVKRSIQC